MNSLEEIRQYLKNFAKKRDWEQFHSPKNLSIALSVEASELLENFTWIDTKHIDELTDEKRAAIADEIADVQMYLVLLADRLGVNILQAVTTKAEKNEIKYPAEQVKGSAKKYTEY
jgi:NTP pyrophosphatase (non-canonical NTP hydrolase)